MGRQLPLCTVFKEGAASKSYGLAVAALAGVPKEVIRRAKQKLKELETLSGHSGQAM